MSQFLQGRGTDDTFQADDRAVGGWESAGGAVKPVVGQVLDAQESELRRAGMRVERDSKGRLLVRLSGRALNFQFGKASLKPQARKTLKTLASILQAYPENRILIEGHTDNIGSVRSNFVLSQARAERVKEQLLKHGVGPQSLVSAVGYGEAYPVADNATARGRTRNRRVELSITIDVIEAEAKQSTRSEHQ